jgi:hypothetical protein
MDKITNIQDAKALKRMGASLNTPVERRCFSAAYSKQWFALMKAHDDFCGALADYIEAESFPKWRRLRKCLNGIALAATPAVAAIDKFKDPIEQTLLAEFLVRRAEPFFNYWVDALDAVEDGTALELTPADWPRWTEED